MNVVPSLRAGGQVAQAVEPSEPPLHPSAGRRARCQSRGRCRQVMPEPQPISWGSISQGMPVEHKQDPGESGKVVNARLSALRLLGLRRQQGLDGSPQSVCREWFGHVLSVSRCGNHSALSRFIFGALGTTFVRIRRRVARLGWMFAGGHWAVRRGGDAGEAQQTEPGGRFATLDRRLGSVLNRVYDSATAKEAGSRWMAVAATQGRESCVPVPSCWNRPYRTNNRQLRVHRDLDLELAHRGL